MFRRMLKKHTSDYNYSLNFYASLRLGHPSIDFSIFVSSKVSSKKNCFSHLKGTDTFIKLNEEKTEIILCDPQTFTCPYQHDHLVLFILLSQRTISLREALQPTQMTLISRELKTIKMSLLVTCYHE